MKKKNFEANYKTDCFIEFGVSSKYWIAMPYLYLEYFIWIQYGRSKMVAEKVAFMKLRKYYIIHDLRRNLRHIIGKVVLVTLKYEKRLENYWLSFLFASRDSSLSRISANKTFYDRKSFSWMSFRIGFE